MKLDVFVVKSNFSFFIFTTILISKLMGHEKTVKKEDKKAATKSLKEKRAEKKAKKDAKSRN
jgi:hypothetical protein